VERLGFVCTVLACLGLSGGLAWADVFAVAKPTTQTVAINGTAASFDGSDSYTDEEMPITDWAWDFDGDGTDDYTENYNDQWGDGLTTHVYDQAGIFTGIGGGVLT